MVGELEATLEGPRGNALVEHVAGLLLVVGLLLAVDRQRILPRLDREISVGEAGDCNRDAIGVLAGPRDTVGRIARRRSGRADELTERRDNSVRADDCTLEGRQ